MPAASDRYQEAADTREHVAHLHLKQAALEDIDIFLSISYLRSSLFMTVRNAYTISHAPPEREGAANPF